MSSILIIGGNSDIGYATAKIFAKNKYNIHLVSRNIEQLNIKKDEIIKLFKVKCKITHLDLLQDDEVNSFFEENVESPKVILIACGFLQTEEKNFDKIVSVNYLSPLKFIEKSIKKYQSQKILKTIIGISSVAGDRGKKKNSIYSSAKSAFSSYLDGLRQRLNTLNIHVITVKPGWVDTKMTKGLNLPKFMTSNVNYIGNKIFKAYKSKKCTLYVPGYWLIIMFIYKIVPEFLFKIFNK
jgi:decaprenylphospho-beta-D-erythro-pentofuranosid-2-ulose 2-reductase